MTPTTETADGPAIPSTTLFDPFFLAPIPADRSSMIDVLKQHLSEAAEKLGFRDGKDGVTVPPAEWCDDTNELQNWMRLAWVRGCKSGMSIGPNA